MLLIIFMAALPLTQRGLDADIPPEVGRVIDAAKGAGVDRVGIVTDGMRREAQAAGRP